SEFTVVNVHKRTKTVCCWQKNMKCLETSTTRTSGMLPPSGTLISFVPDFNRIKIAGIGKDDFAAILTRVFYLVTYVRFVRRQLLQVWFNGRPISIDSFQSFVMGHVNIPKEDLALTQTRPFLC